ncbi:MAG: hypothetical protein ACYCYP_13615, partial [Leptospirales bacterium]
MDFLSLARSEATDLLPVPLEAVVVEDNEVVESSPFTVLLAVLVDPDGVLEAVTGAVEDEVLLPVLLAVLVDPDGVLEAVTGAVEDEVLLPVLLAVLVDPDGVLEA